MSSDDSDIKKTEETTTVTESPDEIKETTKTTTTTTTKAHSNAPLECQTMKGYVDIIKANPLYGETSKLLHWRDPVKTGLIFGIANFFYFLSTWGDYSDLTICCYLFLALLCICIGYSNYVVLKASWLQGKSVENPFKERFKDTKFHASRAAAEQHLTTVLDLVNLTIDEFRDVFYCTDNFLSLRFAFYFYLGATVGNWFSGSTLVYLTMLGLFGWPRLYEEKHTEIDHFYHVARAQGMNYYNLALTKLPPAVTARFPQLKPHST